ncbi:hypothetical protein HBE96_25130 [Clostridium sp. P21]|uniref:Uncharacterized protein n=1 Tax=Clostridium muellerianum TaxID=2716538 RepID=A0A7Y0HQ93_9CLOT|nr:hypothetical protein [Clostridium muellerianum]NMM65864.1 hypothetical protein [Clostridium muellerianum]
MQNHHNYLLTLDHAPSIVPQNGSISTIFDWSAGESFTVVNVISSQSEWSKLVHVLATRDNSYSSQNFQHSKLRYKSNNEQMESREIVKITHLDV